MTRKKSDTSSEEVKETKKELSVSDINEESIVVVSEVEETALNTTERPRGVVQAYFMDQPMRSPYGAKLSRLRDSLVVGGKLYMTPTVRDRMGRDVERYLEEDDEDESGMIVFKKKE